MRSTLLKVLVKAPTYDLTTLENAYEELGITDTSNDSRMTRWISAASVYAAKWCNRVFALETVNELWRGSDNWTVYDTRYPDPYHLARCPVVEIDTIKEHDEPLTVDDYELDAEGGRLWRLRDGYRSDWCGARLEVTYTGGYIVPAETPPDLEQACLMLLKIRNDGIDRDRSLRAQTIPGVLEEQFNSPSSGTASGTGSAMPAEIADILTPYRDYNVP